MVKIENRQVEVFDEATQKIEDDLHIAVPEFYYIPTGMKYDEYTMIGQKHKWL